MNKGLAGNNILLIEGGSGIAFAKVPASPLGARLLNGGGEIVHWNSE